jgi:carboxymethylenebutenolidase
VVVEETQIELIWNDHTAAEFGQKSADAALKTMVEAPNVTILANKAGGRGKEGVRAFYADILIPQWPDDARMDLVNRVVGRSQLVDEMRLSFTHAKQMDWLLPGVPATGKKVEIDVVIVVRFEDGLIAEERIYWDHAAVLRQVGLLDL